MEMEFFVKPGTDEEWHQYWIDERLQWYTDLGINKDNLRLYEHPQEKLSHYSKRTVDIEYKFDFAGTEWGELEGIANRTDFDLTAHGKASGADLSLLRPGDRRALDVPYVIEPAAGVDRAMLTFMLDAYTEDEAPNAKGVHGEAHRACASTTGSPRSRPRCCRCPATPTCRPKARDLAAALRQHWNVDFDDAGAIGRRYRRQDEIGTPFCITVDFDTLDGQRGDRPRARLDGPGAGLPRPGRGLPPPAPQRLRSAPPSPVTAGDPRTRGSPAVALSRPRPPLLPAPVPLHPGPRFPATS